MDVNVGSVLANGGISGIICLIGFIIYKLCDKRHFHSKCCGADIDIDETKPTPANTPIGTPLHSAVKPPIEPPVIVLEK
jgi:hypothetical protein